MTMPENRTDESRDIVSLVPFTNFILSVVTSQLAFNMLNVLLIFIIYDITKSNFLVSFLVISFLIPQIFLSFIGGVYASRRNKRNILLFGNLLRGLLVLVLFLDPRSVFLIYIISLAVSVITQFYIPAETPMIPLIVHNRHLTQANSLFGIALYASILAGYVLAGPGIDFFGWQHVLLFDAAMFLVSCIFLFAIPSKLVAHHHTKDESPENMKGSIIVELANTYKIIRGSKDVLTAILLLGLSQLIILLLATVVPGYAETLLEVPPQWLSLILFAPAAAGMIITSFLIGSLFSKASKDLLVNTGLFLSALSLCLFPFTSRIVSEGYLIFINEKLNHVIILEPFHFTMLLSFLAGAGNALVFVPSQTIIQERIPEDFRSKIYGLLFSIIGILSLLPVILAGGIADLIGVGGVLFGLGLIVLFAAFLKIKFR